MDSALYARSEDSFQPRAYQLEMLEESLKRNVIVAMDTGSGKTHIAILRIAAELERATPDKLVWFLCPSIALAEQQHNVISSHLSSFQSRLLSGNDGIDRWSEQSTWNDALRNVNVVVCTHQVLLDALIHGFVHMRDIALLVFDEAHHCAGNHPANTIMRNFYHVESLERQGELPAILGLTASPVVKKSGEGLQAIERNLNAISKTPRLNREELGRFVHAPEMVVLVYPQLEAPFPTLLQKLIRLYENLDIEQDPYIAYLRSSEPEKYVEVRTTRNTYCQNQIRRLVRMATELNMELGPWTSDIYIRLCILRFQAQRQPALSMLEHVEEAEKIYITHLFASLDISTIAKHSSPQDGDISPKTRELIRILNQEISEESAGIVFVKTRVAVKLLSVLLATHPVTKDILRIGTFVGTSNNKARVSYISDLIDIREQKDTLNDLRVGAKNLVLATSVCEEGIDITACNIVVCFEKPPNLKSFIQRRGRARNKKSKFVIMFPEGQKQELLQWHNLEAAMKEKYMDDMRALEELETFEWREDESFSVPSTNAKMMLPDALRHLYHFCNTLPAVAYTVLEPTFIFDYTADGDLSCRVILPNSVDSSAREFTSVGSHSTEKEARMDAAFEAYLGLHRAGLVNDHLLPSPWTDEEAVKAYAKVEKRPGVTIANSRFNPWPAMTVAWPSKTTLYNSAVRILSGGTLLIQMTMISPCWLPRLMNLELFVDAQRRLIVEIGEAVEAVMDNISVATANEITRLLFASVFSARLKEEDDGFPLLFIPREKPSDLHSWLDNAQGSYDAGLILGGIEDPAAIGLVRDQTQPGSAYVLHDIEQIEKDEPPETVSCLSLKVKKFSKRTDFLHPVSADAVMKKGNFRFLNPKDCRIDRLPLRYTQFAKYIPSIMHHVEKTLLTERMCTSILAPLEFSGPTVVLPAICCPAAREHCNYQRLEFFGDSILKLLTSLALMADHQTWHEGYLSRAKDHIVSNVRLASSARKTSLDNYILTTSFTGKKWKPLTNIALGRPQKTQEREISTKSLADVVEAVIGAAFVDGGFPKALACLRIFLPEVSWLPLAERNNVLLHAVCETPDRLTIPSNITILETLVGHTFRCKSILLEAVTHPSYLSVPSTPSYQRLEYLGDAILDYLVTTTIFSHNDPSQTALQPGRMHILRASTVNASFLTFCALSHIVSIPIAAIETSEQDDPPVLHPSFKPISLSNFLRYAPIPALKFALNATRTRFAALQTSINTALGQEFIYPWRLLAALAPEKVFSDMVEAVLGAVYIDTGGDMDVCCALLRRFGILNWLETALKRDIQIWHPKEKLGWVARNKKVKYRVWTEERDKTTAVSVLDLVDASEEKIVLGKGRYRCELSVDGREICIAQGWNRSEVEIAAAEEGIRILSMSEN